MTFCLNPDCQNPQNTHEAKRCGTCGSKLLLKARYRPLKLLGKGRGSSTFLAIDERKRTKPQCVIKQYIPPSGTNQPQTQLFERTTQQISALSSSPHLPKLLDTCQQEGRCYFVFDYILGLNLEQELYAEGAFTEKEIRQLISEILPLLQTLHQQQLIHTDIKPDNIIHPPPDPTTPTNTPRPYILVGFGGSRHTTGHIYTAPETIQGQTTPSSDLYSLGITCIHLLTRIHPLELLDSQQDAWVWQDYLRHELAKPLQVLLRALLQRNPINRYQTAAEVLQDFNPHPPPAPPLAPPKPQPQNWQCTSIFKGHDYTIRCLALDPQEKILASASYDGILKLWDMNTGQLLHTLEGHGRYLQAIAFTPDGQTLVSSGNDATVNLWQPHTGQLKRTFTKVETSIQSLAITPDGQILATGENTGIIKLWDLNTGALLDTLYSPDSSPWHGLDALAFSPDGRLLVSSCEVWDITTGKRLYNFMAEAIWGYSVAISPDGQTFAVTGDMDKTGKLLNIRTGLVIRTFKGHLKSLRAVEFSPDGQILATGSKDGRIKLWDINTGTSIQTLPGHSQVVFDLIFSKDGKTLISASQDKKIKVWQCLDAEIPPEVTTKKQKGKGKGKGKNL